MADDRVAAYLNDTQRRYEVFGESDTLPALLAAVEAVLAIHYETAGKCARCLGAWPCGEYLEISAALLGEADRG